MIRASTIKILILLFSFAFVMPAFSFAASEIDETVKAIKEKNGKWSAKKTSISKLSPDDRKKRVSAIVPVPTGKEKHAASPSAQLPAAVDWRNYAGGNYVTPIKEQGACGICWAFASTAALESNILISKNTPTSTLDLSEQILTSCGSVGTCSGGLIDAAADFIRDYGLPGEACYPYSASDGICSNASANWFNETYKIADWYRVDQTVDA